MDKNYYDILGVSKNASDEEIKSAYRKLALKWHPDRWASKSEAEKADAEQKFKDIAEAYGVLSDPEKKRNYDMFGTADGSPHMGGGFESGFPGGFPGGFGSFDDVFNFFGGRRGAHANASNVPEPGASLNYQFGVSLEEIYNGGSREIEYDIESRCGHCNGTGGTGLETCPYCHGTGMITEVKRMGYSTIQTSHPCHHCGGAGTVIKNKCSHCGGTGVLKTKKKVKVDIPRGVEEGYVKAYPGYGYESKNPNGRNGDLNIQFVYQFDEKKYRISGNNVYELVNVPYYDCIAGAKKTVKLPDGTTADYEVPKYTKDGAQIPIVGKGLKGIGNYIIVVNIDMPNAVASKEMDLIQKIQKLHKK